ncbi:type VI secretion system protein TssA [Azospirillum sp. TSH64]|uniref:type VI secretion system protein TssA n=1 Tax=Azospirillum sp. TSH64 TaxID=652740 RepID=UPI001304BDBF|nr:type VI secretion system protein TssA [Azospirillum sp. TSH64]
METAFVDVEAMLREIAAAKPEGENCEYDPAFTELEKKAEGQPERQLGDVVQPAVPPEWREVLALTTGLFGRTKDIRVALHLCRALLGLHGLPGLAQGLDVFHGLLERYWPTLHPQLDPDDDDDPTMRVNIVAGLAHHETMLRAVRESIVVSARTAGRFTLRQVVAASAANPPEGTDTSLVDAAFQECAIDDLRATAEAAKRSYDRIRRIEMYVTDQVGASNAVDLSAIASVLREASALLNARLTARATGGGEAQADGRADSRAEGGTGSSAGEDAPTGVPAAVAVAAVRPGAPGIIASNEDVVKTLDRICDYYAKNEPSSPVPQILQRARRLVGLNFMDLLRDLTPDGVGQFETISGIRRDD